MINKIKKQIAKIKLTQFKNKKLIIYISAAILVILVLILSISLIQKMSSKSKGNNAQQQNTLEARNNNQQGMNRVSSTTLQTSFSIEGRTGTTRLSGVRAEQIEDDRILTSGFIAEDNVSFVINFDDNTVFYKAGATSSLSDLIVGNPIFVTGSLQSFGSEITITAKDIRIMGAPISTSTRPR